CGTITAAANASVFQFQGGGSESGCSSPITLLFEPGSVLQAPYFSADGAIQDNGFNCTVIDGGSNGTIVNTRSGSSGLACPGGPCQYQEGTLGVGARGSNITIKNLRVESMYVRKDSNGDESCSLHSCSGISIMQ